MKSLKICLYADLHYKKGMYIAGVEDMHAITTRAHHAGAAFCIHLGDFCNDYSGSPELVKACLENPYDLPMYGVYGNHELESGGNSMAVVTPLLNNRPVHWGTADGQIGDGSVAYYYFDHDAFRIIGLDTNYSIRPTADGDVWEHNPTASWGPRDGNRQANALGPDQTAWLEAVLMDAAEKGLHCLVFSHISHAGLWLTGPDAAVVRALYRKANEQKPGTVLAAINGHSHDDHRAVVEDVLYLSINTVRNIVWRPQRTPHYTDETCLCTDYDSSGAAISKEEKPVSSLWMSANTWYTKDPLSAILTVTEDGTFTVEGADSDWYGGIHPASDNVELEQGEGPKITGGTYTVKDILTDHIHVPAKITTPDGRAWELTFHDEFSGTELDAAKWHICHGERRQDAGGYWDKSQVKLDGEGHLVLGAAIGEDGRPLSGAIRSVGHFEQAYGYFEARMQLPKATGYWAAFWLLCRSMGKGIPNAEAGAEFDIVESGECLRGGVNHAIHWGGYGENLHSKSQCFYGGDWYEGFHTYAMAWTKTEYIFYIDGVETWRTAEMGICKEPAYLKLTAEFGSWAGPIQPEQLPDYALVDWVRVYKEV